MRYIRHQDLKACHWNFNTLDGNTVLTVAEITVVGVETLRHSVRDQ